jgi:26S proteasome regulatory subunit N6
VSLTLFPPTLARPHHNSLLQKQDYQSAVPLLTELIREVKRLDDKQQLVEVHLIESALHFETKNANRSKAALTAARTAANAIYVPPGLQADIDVQAGTLLAQEKDFKTSYSYFVEAYEGYNTLEDKRAVSCVKYMLLAKIMLKQSDEVRGIMASKAAIKHAGTDLEAMKAVADANQARDLDAFDKATAKYDKELKGDPVIVAHLGDLYDNLLEQNLLRLIEPFSKVETTHIAKLIALDHSVVQEKLSQMILDKKLNGILDQGNGCLILHDPSDKDAVYEASIETVATLGSVVDNLYSKARKISA